MTVKRITLNTEKTTPIYEYPITLRQGDTSIQIPVDLEEDFSEKDLTKTKLEFYSDKPDATTIEDDEQSHFQIGADKKSFTYTFPDELTDASGSTTNTYFKIGNDSTSNFYIHILTKAGMEKLESGDYISKVDRIFNHVMSDYTAINDLAETGKGTFDTALAASKKEMKDLMDNLNAKYVQFINSKTTEFKTFLANLDSQAADVKNKYNALKTQLDALEVPEIGTRNYLLNSLKEVFYTGQNIVNQLIYPWSFSFGQISGNAVVNQIATFSVDWRVDKVTTTGYMVPQVNAKPWQINGENQIKPTAEKMSGHYTYTFRITEDLSNSLSTMLGFQVNYIDGTIRFKNAQLKLSNVETDLTIAQEDFLNDTYNLLPDSKEMTSWVKKMTSVDLQQDTDGYNMIHMFGNYSSYYTVVSLKKGKEYTFSGDFKMYNNGPISLVFYISDLDNPDGDGQGIPISDVGVNSWTRMSVTFESKYMIQNAMVRVEAYGDWKGIGGSVFAKKLQLEPGLTSRPWGPNPLDATNLQKQAIFNTGNWVLAVCGSGTDFGDFLKSDKVPRGFSIIRDNNSLMNWKILKESNNTIYGMSQDLSGNIYHSEVLNGEYKGYKSIYATMTGKTITATDDTGKTVKLKITGIS